MSILGAILGKIFPAGHPAAANAPASSPASIPTPTVAAASAATPGQSVPPTSGSQSTQAAQQHPEVDVEQLLDQRSAQAHQKLNWRSSIVDLLKLLDLDSTLSARKALAQELHYTGDTNDSATMNLWLHKQVMSAVAANGGKVPPEFNQH